jgi:two-component system chemotaxis response regulator CheB
MKPVRAGSIRVLIVEDSPVVAELLAGIIDADEDMEVVGLARNGREGVDLCRRLRPDVVTMDIRMPVMDGFEATETIMVECPTPILVVSASLGEGDLDICFNAIQAGAMDVVEKPESCFSREYVAASADITSRIRVVSRIRPIRRHKSYQREMSRRRMEVLGGGAQGSIVAIAASTGGPAALARILGDLPGSFPWPVLVVQHIAPGFTEGFVRWLDTQTELDVRMGEPGQRPLSGHVYFASEGCHLGLDGGGRLILDPAAPVDGHRPSATYLFRSVARAYGPRGIGVILTGMGRDGARGLVEMKEAGGVTLAQDEETSLIYGMPRAAIEAGAVDEQLPLESISRAILNMTAGDWGENPASTRERG